MFSLSRPSTIDFQILFESLPGLYLILAPDFTIAAVSNDYLNATKTIRKDIIGRGIFDVFPDNPDDPNATGTHNLRASLERVLRYKKADTMAVQKYDILRPESEGGGFEERYWSPINSPLLSKENTVLYIIHRVEDVTEFVRLKQEKTAGKSTDYTDDVEIYLRAQEIQETSRRLEQELWQAQKMEVIGQLSGGMAHDFNNLLGIILGNLEMMETLPSPHKEECRQSAIRAVDRGAELVKALLAFSRQQPLNPMVIHVNEHLADHGKLLKRVLGESIELAMHLEPDTWAVHIDPTQLESAITNLAVNARDAMPKGGRLTFNVGNNFLEDDYVSQNQGVIPGPYVCIEVTDTGSGMPPEVLFRVFEPFFTTKEKDRGTGLGLAMVYGFVKQSKGHIKIYSEVGHGTTVKIYLPRYEGTKQASAPKTEALPVAASRNETILVIEDNQDVRQMVLHQLQDLGYKTIEATNGPEAMKMIEDNIPFDLLFTDIIMPGGVSGFDVARFALERRPKLPVLLTSGFPGAVTEDQQEVRPGTRLELLSKPYRKSVLARQLRDMLDKG